MYNNEIFKTIKIYLEPCARYGGIQNENENACCIAGCGTCGGTGCADRNGINCCVRQIPEQQICGPWQDAPCLLASSEGKKDC